MPSSRSNAICILRSTRKDVDTDPVQDAGGVKAHSHRWRETPAAGRRPRLRTRAPGGWGRKTRDRSLCPGMSTSPQLGAVSSANRTGHGTHSGTLLRSAAGRTPPSPRVSLPQTLNFPARREGALRTPLREAVAGDCDAPPNLNTTRQSESQTVTGATRAPSSAAPRPTVQTALTAAHRNHQVQRNAGETAQQ